MIGTVGTVGSMNVNDWIYAQLIITIQTALLAALFTNPLHWLLDFMANLVTVKINALGWLSSVTISGKLPLPGDESVSMESSMLAYLMEETMCTSNRIVNGRLAPSGWILSRKAIGRLSSTGMGDGGTVTFEGRLFARSRRYMEELRRLSAGKVTSTDVDASGGKSTIQSIVSKYQRYSFDDIPIVTKVLPLYVLKSQQRVIDMLVTEYKRICGRVSIRGNHYMSCLVTGPPGCGKTVMVDHLTKSIGGFLIYVSNITDESVMTLRSNVKTIRGMADLENTDVISFYAKVLKTTAEEKKKKKNLPIVVLVDEFDSVISSTIPKVPNDVIDKMREDGLTGQDLTDAIELLRDGMAKETAVKKHTINAFMDALTVMDNVIAVFISNSSMSDFDASYTREGRITHRVDMPMLVYDEILDLVSYTASKFGWDQAAAVNKIGRAIALPEPTMPDNDTDAVGDDSKDECGLRYRGRIDDRKSSIDTPSPIACAITATTSATSSDKYQLKCDPRMTVAKVVQVMDLSRDVDDAVDRFTQMMQSFVDADAIAARKKKLGDVSKYLSAPVPKTDTVK